MVAASRNPHADEPAELRNTPLADALQTRDIAAIAFALRHGPTIVPIIDSVDDQVWTYLNPETGEVALLLFSDAKHKPASLPPTAAPRSPAWLRTYLTEHGDDIAVVFFDIAGPHPMQASPDEILRALEA